MSRAMGASERIAEARQLLQDLGFDAERSNERSARVLLALLALGPDGRWSEARAPLLRTAEIIAFIDRRYGLRYAPNTRETIRRFTLHQFADELLVLQNPDRPDRAINSPRWCYQVEPAALDVARAFGTAEYPTHLAEYLAQRPGQVVRHAAARGLVRLPVRIGKGHFVLSPGGQNELIRKIIEEFCPRFTPGAEILYVGDADEKWLINEVERFAELGVRLDQHGKMPDLVAWIADREWLVLLEAVTSHGPIDTRRRLALRRLFSEVVDKLVLVSCFPDRATMRKYLTEIAWETEVWCADHPDHLIHFDGARLLGPYG